MDIAVWLRSLGLGKYEAAFRENEIDETVLASLTHETLKELGGTAVGPRLKLLDAIAALRTDASGKVTSVCFSSAPSASARPARAIRLSRRPARDIDPVLVDGMTALDLNRRLKKRTFVSASIHSVMLEFDIRWAGRTCRNLARWCRDFPD